MRHFDCVPSGWTVQYLCFTFVKTRIASTVNDDRTELQPIRKGSSLQTTASDLLDASTSALIVDQGEIDLLCAHYDVVLLYGSCARGDARSHSDVDLLVLDDSHESHLHLPERFSLTVYTPNHLRGMARRGSLFVLHLRQESKILIDRHNVIPSLLNEWVAPNYRRLREGMKAAATALDFASKVVPALELRRAVLFVLRSVLYAACAERGRPSFAMSSVAQTLDDTRIANLFSGIDAKSDEYILAESKVLFESYLGRLMETEFEDLEAMAVSWYKRYPMASHIAVQILTEGAEIGYTSAPIDWVPT
jgi:hypothetical protein